MKNYFDSFVFRILLFILFIALISCSSKFDGKNGTSIIYFEGSDKVHQVIEYKNGKKNGRLIEYYPNGNYHVRQFFVNDTLTDSSFVYYENGRIANFQFGKNHKREGCWKNFNKSGKVVLEINYKNNLLNGPMISYSYSTGKVLERLNYVDNVKDGKQQSFYENGKCKYVAYYNHGRPDWGTEEWYDNGEKVNNDFKLTIYEKNNVLMENKLYYIVKPENSCPDDYVCLLSNKGDTNHVNIASTLVKEKGQYVYEIVLLKGMFIMETLKFGVFRKTKMGNVFIKTATINASMNNY